MMMMMTMTMTMTMMMMTMTMIDDWIIRSWTPVNLSKME